MSNILALRPHKVKRTVPSAERGRIFWRTDSAERRDVFLTERERILASADSVEREVIFERDRTPTHFLARIQ